jgi:hypothetical protein
VDVGASVPVLDSVTFHFYEHGWSGVNIEPDLAAFEELVVARVRDVNINAVVGTNDGAVTFYRSDTRAMGRSSSLRVLRRPARHGRFRRSSRSSRITPRRAVSTS